MRLDGLPNWVGPALALIHAAAVVGALLAKEPLPPPSNEACPEGAVCIDDWSFAGESIIAARPFHWHYETVGVKFLLATDLPVIVASGVLLAPTLPHMDRLAASYLHAALWIVVGSLQWWVIGRAFVRRCLGAH